MKRIIGSRGMKETAPIVSAPNLPKKYHKEGKRHGRERVADLKRSNRFPPFPIFLLLQPNGNEIFHLAT